MEKIALGSFFPSKMTVGNCITYPFYYLLISFSIKSSNLYPMGMPCIYFNQGVYYKIEYEQPTSSKALFQSHPTNKFPEASQSISDPVQMEGTNPLCLSPQSREAS
jgi:hypothetical protein